MLAGTGWTRAGMLCAAAMACLTAGCDLLLIVGQQRSCGGLLGLACPGGQYCSFEDGSCGAADQLGVCRDIPEACTLEFAPVCGCDDQTYGNACAAAAAGVSVAREGACDAPAPCGGLQGLACPDGQYCNHTDGSCGAADQTGECTAIPEVCTEEFAPVCGCDDRTYANACFAAAAGVSVLHDGPCGQACGGPTDGVCPEGSYCLFPEGDCGGGEVAGECRTLSEVCPEIFAPVCGCDGMTYGNDCEAGRAGVSVDHVGSCDGFCGGIAGFPCPEGQFCQFEDGICGDGDQSGTCAVVPEVCTDEVNPVCGCDGVTYSNECHANAAGISVRSAGECAVEGEPGPG